MNTLQRFTPNGATKITDKHSSAVAYTYENNGYICACGFSGKRKKADYRFRFNDTTARIKPVEYHFKNVQAAEKSRKERSAARTSFNHTLTVGDILYASWGYDQTNIDFYQVVEVVGKKSVKIRGIYGSSIRQSTGADYVVASKDSFKDRDVFLNDQNTATLKRVKKGNIISISTFANAYPWDGKEKYETATGWGHEL